MNREDIIRMAKECGYWSGQTIEMNDVGIEQFAALVAAAAVEQERKEFAIHAVDIARRAVKEENEACAQFLESTRLGSLPADTALHYARLLKSFAEGIRARGQA